MVRKRVLCERAGREQALEWRLPNACDGARPAAHGRHMPCDASSAGAQSRFCRPAVALRARLAMRTAPSLPLTSTGCRARHRSGRSAESTAHGCLAAHGGGDGATQCMSWAGWRGSHSAAPRAAAALSPGTKNTAAKRSTSRRRASSNLPRSSDTSPQQQRMASARLGQRCITSMFSS